MSKVLLIEDDRETADEVALELTRCGHAVTRAATGDHGLALAHGPFDVMVIDRLLPSLEGLDIIKTLRGEGVRTPALVVSALGGLDDRVRGLRAGGDDYLAKPFALVELVARLDALLRRPVETRETLLRLGPLELDLLTRSAKRGERATDDLRRFQIEQRETGVPVPTMNSIVSALRFFFTHTLDRPDPARKLRAVERLDLALLVD